MTAARGELRNYMPKVYFCGSELDGLCRHLGSNSMVSPSTSPSSQSCISNCDYLKDYKKWRAPVIKSGKEHRKLSSAHGSFAPLYE